MDARESLHRIVGTDIWDDEDCALFDSFLDAYAHELSEEIRERQRNEWENLTADFAADLIDPEVQK